MNPVFKARKPRRRLNHCYLPFIAGASLIATGIWILFFPFESYEGLSVLFSMTFLFTGIAEIVFAVFNRTIIDNWGWTLVIGALTAAVAMMLINNDSESMKNLPLYMGFVIMFRSFSAIGISMDLKHYGILEWGSLLMFGILGVLVSFILIWHPIFADMTIIFWTAIGLTITGIFDAYLAIKLRSLRQNWDDYSDEAIKRWEEERELINDKNPNRIAFRRTSL